MINYGDVWRIYVWIQILRRKIANIYKKEKKNIRAAYIGHNI